MVLLTMVPVSIAAAETVSGCLKGQTVSYILHTAQPQLVTARLRIHSADVTRRGAALSVHSQQGGRVLLRDRVGGEEEALFILPETGARLIVSAPSQSRLCYVLTWQRTHLVSAPPAAENGSPSSRRLQQLQAALGNRHQRAAALTAFWREMARRGTPLVEPLNRKQGRVTFLWRGARHNVRLIGGPSNDHEWLARLPKSDVWYRSFVVANDVRSSYQLAPDIPQLQPDTSLSEVQSRQRQRHALLATAQADPLNPHRFHDASLLVLPAAPAQPPLYPSGRTGKQTLQILSFHSARLRNTRRVWLYRNIAVTPDSRPIRLYVFDGGDYVQAGIPRILDTLSHRGYLPPLVAVFIDNPDHTTRARELPGNPLFADMMAHELVPFIKARTGLLPDGPNTIIGGSSYGGLAAAYVASRYPQQFGQVLSLSGSFWWRSAAGSKPQSIQEMWQRLPQQTTRWFISAGRFETDLQDNDGIRENSAALAQILRQHGYEVHWREYGGGHDYAVWRGALIDGLLTLLRTAKVQ